MSWLVLNIRDLVVDLDISLFAHMFRRDDYFQRADTLARVQTDDSDSKMSKSHEDSCHVVSSTRFIGEQRLDSSFYRVNFYRVGHRRSTLLP